MPPPPHPAGADEQGRCCCCCCLLLLLLSNLPNLESTLWYCGNLIEDIANIQQPPFELKGCAVLGTDKANQARDNIMDKINLEDEDGDKSTVDATERQAPASDDLIDPLSVLEFRKHTLDDGDDDDDDDDDDDVLVVDEHAGLGAFDHKGSMESDALASHMVSWTTSEPVSSGGDRRAGPISRAVTSFSSQDTEEPAPPLSGIVSEQKDRKTAKGTGEREVERERERERG